MENNIRDKTPPTEREMPMTRTGRTFDQYLAEYLSTAPAEELELLEEYREALRLRTDGVLQPRREKENDEYGETTGETRTRQ